MNEADTATASGGAGAGGAPGAGALLDALGATYELDPSTGAFTVVGGRLDRLDASLDAAPPAWADLVHPLDRERVAAALEGARPGEAVDLEHRLLARGRETRVRNLARRDPDGRVRGALLPAEPPHPPPGRLAREVLEGALDALPMPVIVRDDARRAVFVNCAACDMFGHPPERLLDRGLEQVLSPAAVAAFEALDRAALDGGGPAAASVALADAQGVVKHMACVKTSFRPAPGRRYVVCVAHDVALLSHIELERERGREFLAQILDTVADPIFVKDERHRWIMLNRAFEELLGQPREVLIGRSDADFFPPEETEVFWAKDDLVFRTGEVNENEEPFTDARGRRHVILTKKKAFTAPDGRRVLVGVIRDITERRAAEQALRESEERFRAIFNQGPLGMAVLDLQLRVRRVNDMLCAMLGTDEAALIGRRLTDLTHAEDRGPGDDTAAHLLSGALTARKAERRFLRADGGVLWASVTLSLINDAEGEPLHFLAMLEDVGERKRAEAALLEARDAALRSAQTKARFLATVSHEIRTPLNAVIGLTGLLLDGELEPEQRESVELIRSSGDALLTLLNDILDFSKLESDRMELERRPFDLGACIEESLDLVAPRAGEKGLELSFLPAAGVPRWVTGDSTRLRQVLVNLLSNAVKFTQKGEVRLEVKVAGPDALRFAVIDTGIGIPPDRLDRLFQSFSQVDASTTRQFGGTGLGLAISRSLVERMGGRMWVESAPGRGSTFEFSLPVAVGAPPRPGTLCDGEPDPALAGRRLLVVDDVASVRERVVRAAAAWGMEASAAADLDEVRARLREGGRFDAILVDRHLAEGVDAVDVAREVHALLRDAAPPLVLLTPMGRAGSKRLRTIFRAQLTKPVKLDALRALLRRLTTGERGRAQGERRVDPDLARRVPLRILVVDDNAVNLRVAQRMLECMGYRADLAGSGPEALAAIQRQPYDVVLLDVQMPHMDGLEVARRVAALPGRRPRLVALTADVLHGDRERCLAAGMDDFVGKPVRVEELQAALLRCASARAAAAPEAEEPPVVVIDEEAVRGLSVLGDGPPDEPAADLLGVLLADVPGQLRAMEEALERRDLTTLSRVAHGLRGGSANLGARLLEDAAARIERAARDGDAARIPALLDQARAALERTREAARRRFPGRRFDPLA